MAPALPLQSPQFKAFPYCCCCTWFSAAYYCKAYTVWYNAGE